MSEEPLSGIRASDEDRERLIDQLRDHAGAGRLSTDELEERLQAAYDARTTADLDALRRDLPPTPRDTALTLATRRSHLTRRMLQESGGAFGLFLVCTVIWAVSGAQGQFWPVWVLLVAVLSVARIGWALFGPGADLDAAEARLDERRQHRDRHDHHDHRRSRRGRRL